MILTDNSSLNKLMVKLKENILLGEGIRYSIPDLWNCFDYNGQEKFVDEKGVTLVNPYRFYFSCINDYIIIKKDNAKDYNKSISQMLYGLNEKKDYLGGDWIINSSIYAMDVKVSTAWDHNSNGYLEECNENGFKETGTFLKTIALLPLLKKMGINTLYLLKISKFDIQLEDELDVNYIVKDFFTIDSQLKDNMVGEDFSIEEEFKSLVEACHILDIRVIIDIIPKFIAKDNELILSNPTNLIKENLFIDDEINEMLWNTLSKIIPYYQSNLGIDGVRLDFGYTLPMELVHRIIESSRRLDKDFCIITEELFADIGSARKMGCNMISDGNYSLGCMISEWKTYEFIQGLSKLRIPTFTCLETIDTQRIAAREGGHALSKLLIVLNEFLPNSVSVITSGLEMYEIKPLNKSSEISWIGNNRWDIPDTLGIISKIKNQFLDTFKNASNFFCINFESPYTTAIGFAYIIEGRRNRPNDNLIIIVANTDLYNCKEYTLFLENIRYQSGNCSKKAWLMYSQNEWTHDIYDFNHESDLQLSFKPGEVKILIM